MLKLLAALMLLSAGLDVARAAALEGRTPLGTKSPKCSFNQRSEGMTCAGLGGWKIVVGLHTLEPSICFVAPGQSKCFPDVKPADGVTAHRVDVGTFAVWRGSAVAVPAEIVKPDDLQAAIEDGTGTSGLQRLKILEVFQLAPEGSCTIAYIDASDPAAEMLVQRTTTEASTRHCPVARIALPGAAAQTLPPYLKSQ